MRLSKKIWTLSALAGLVIIGVAATRPPQEKFKNLKILPRDISEAKLDSIMNSYNKALGIGCGFCHTPMKENPDSLDFASDENPMKHDARKMMEMTILINKTYFHYNKEEKPEEIRVVSCITCHRGEAYPEM